MPRLVGFGTFAALPEERISEKISRRILSGDQGMIVWWSIGAGVHVEPHSHANEQIAWMLKGKMEFRLGGEQRVCGQGEVVVIFATFAMLKLNGLMALSKNRLVPLRQIPRARDWITHKSQAWLDSREA
jgi:Cupin domain